MTIHLLPALIDCRSVADYRAGHIAGACSLPAEQLFQRMHELPKRQVPLCLCGSPAELALASAYLIDRGHQVSEQIIWSERLVEQLSAEGKLETGTQSRPLWQPAPLWQRLVTELLPRHKITPATGLDIACGAGRDMVYLAQQGWQMTGVDRSADSLQRVAVLAEHSGVTVNTLQLDLETGENPFVVFAGQQFTLITVARYLHRPLFPWIRELLQPGGIIVYQTFMRGAELTAVGRPRNPNFLLKPAELAGHFRGMDILLDAVELLDDGRPLSAFVARKPID